MLDKYILKMKALEKRYSIKLIKKAQKEYKKMSRSDIENLKFAVMGVEEVPTYYFNAYPGTELFDMLIKDGMI